MGLTPIQELDEILKIVGNEKNIRGIHLMQIYDSLKEKNIEIGPLVLTEILQKLEDDKNIRVIERDVTFGNELILTKCYLLTFEGRKLIYEHGYAEHDRILNQRQAWADKIDEAGPIHQKRLNNLTALLIVVAIVVFAWDFLKYSMDNAYWPRCLYVLLHSCHRY